MLTGLPGQPVSGQRGLLPSGARPPGDQHHEDVPRGGLGPGLSGARLARVAYGQAGAESDQLWSTVAYLGMIFFLFAPPLIIYLAKRRQSPFVRYHAAQALNLWITAFLYTVSCLILGSLLALDTIGTALAVGLPLAGLVWVSAVAYAIMGGVSASRGSQRDLPAWICSPMVK